MPPTSHVCPKCSYENPCFFAEGDIVSLKDDVENAPAPWTGMVLEVERDASGRVYRVLWGPQPAKLPASGGLVERHSGAHRGEELQRFLVPLYGMITEIGVSGGGAKEPQAHRLGPPRP
jgi:hypothetical protein